MTPALAFVFGMVAGAAVGCFMMALCAAAADEPQADTPTTVPEIAPPGCCGMNRE